VPIRRELRNCLCFNVAELDLLEKTLLALGVRTVHQSVQLEVSGVVIIHYRCSQRDKLVFQFVTG
jgi:hypothetical protein